MLNRYMNIITGIHIQPIAIPRSISPLAIPIKYSLKGIYILLENGYSILLI